MSKLVSSNKGLTKVTAIMIAVVIVVVAVGGGIAWWYAAETRAPNKTETSTVFGGVQRKMGLTNSARKSGGATVF